MLPLQGIRRTSNLLAPIMQLVGHGGDVLGLSFSPDGSSIASCSFDRTILLWRTYDECENYMMLRGHKNAVTQVCTNTHPNPCILGGGPGPQHQYLPVSCIHPTRGTGAAPYYATAQISR